MTLTKSDFLWAIDEDAPNIQGLHGKYRVLIEPYPPGVRVEVTKRGISEYAYPGSDESAVEVAIRMVDKIDAREQERLRRPMELLGKVIDDLGVPLLPVEDLPPEVVAHTLDVSESPHPDD